jgi:hypothetical protein
VEQADVFGAISTMSDDELGELIRLRPDLGVPAPRSLRDLAQRAEMWPSQAPALLALDAPAHQLIHVLCLLPAPASLEQAAALMGPVPAPALEPVAARLRARALAWGSDAALRISPGIRSRLHYPANLGRPAADLMATRSRHELENLARALGLSPTGNKGPLTRRLVEALANPATITKVLAQAPEGVQALLDRLDDHPVGQLPIDYMWAHRGRSVSPARWLVERGLVMPTGWGTVEMPREVGLARRGGVAFTQVDLAPPPVTGEAVDPQALAKAAGAAGDSVLAALARLVRALGDAPAALLKAGGVGARELKRLAKAADVDPEEAPLLLELAHAAHLVAVGEAGVAPTPAFDAWSSAPPPQRWLAVVEGWLAHRGEPARAGHKDHDGKTIPALDGSVDLEAPARRASFLATLAAGPAHHRPARAELVAAAVWRAPMAWAHHPHRQAGEAAWVADQAELLGLTGHGALSAPGRALAAGDRDGARHEAAAMLSGPTATFTLQADLTAVTPPNLDPDVRAELALMATVESAGGATVWRFNEASIGRCLDTGRSADDIVAFLDAHAAKGVPQGLAYLVTDTARRHGNLRVGGVASYLRSDDPALVAQALRMRRAGALGLRQLAPTVAVSTAPPGELVAALRSAGFLPVAEGADGAVLVTRPAPARATGQHAGPAPAGPLDDDARRQLVAHLRATPAAPPKAPAAPPKSPASPPRRAPQRTNVVELFAGHDHEPEPEWVDVIDLDPDELALVLADAEAVTIDYRDQRGRDHTVTGMVLTVAGDVVVVLPFGGSRPREVPLDGIEGIELLGGSDRSGRVGGRR